MPKLLENYLDSRGLTLSPEKTLITHLDEGFDFLGINFRSYKTNKGMVIKTKPSNSSRECPELSHHFLPLFQV